MNHPSPLIDQSPEVRTSFRIITQYDVATDTLRMRLDVKVGTQQLHVPRAIASLPECSDIHSEPGVPIRSTDPLIEPRGVAFAKSFLVERAAFAKELREMADFLDSTGRN